MPARVDERRGLLVADLPRRRRLVRVAGRWPDRVHNNAIVPREHLDSHRSGTV